MRVAFLLVFLAATIFALSDTSDWLGAIYLSFLLVGLPVLAREQLRFAEISILSRKQAYVTSGIAILSIGSLSLVFGLGGEMDQYFYISDWKGQLLASLVLTVLGLGILLTVLFFRRHFGIKETEITRHLIPITAGDKLLFAVLAVCAGFGEEIAYRGYAVTALMTSSGSPFVAVILSSAAFGMVHSYQGLLGIFRTGIIGLMMGFALLYTHSIWPVIIAHVSIDLLVGFVLTEMLAD